MDGLKLALRECSVLRCVSKLAHLAKIIDSQCGHVNWHKLPILEVISWTGISLAGMATLSQTFDEVGVARKKASQNCSYLFILAKVFKLLCFLAMCCLMMLLSHGMRREHNLHLYEEPLVIDLIMLPSALEWYFFRCLINGRDL